MRKLKFLTICVFAALLFAASAFGNITVFENNETGWMAASIAKGTINWDDVSVSDGGFATILPNRYSSMYGSPTLSVDSSSGLYVINPNSGYYGTDFFPVSEENVFSPDTSGSPEGTLTVSFDKSMYALGAWFLDVEGDYAYTGIKVGGTLYSFTGNQGDNSKSFLGIVSSTPFTTADICMATGPANNGVGIDDLSYGVVPAPGAFLLGSIGVSIVGWMKRRRSL